ncbi:MAG TPA: hypothetical protein VNX86_04855 [Rhizomicrobium sp.]|nr:hypothetical protein [Rhizomicrobium sp.]
MGDKIKRTADNRRIDENFLKVPIRRAAEPVRLCKVCGAPGTVIVSTHKATEHYCDAHLPAEYRAP